MDSTSGDYGRSAIFYHWCYLCVGYFRNRDRGYEHWKAIMVAGKVRLRPILLTSITTIFGLLPIALGVGGKSITWQPLALTIVCGLTVSSLLTLFVVPCLYGVVLDISNRFQK